MVEFDLWPRKVDLSKPGAKQYPGWPITVNQLDNYGRKAVAYLPMIGVKSLPASSKQVLVDRDRVGCNGRPGNSTDRQTANCCGICACAGATASLTHGSARHCGRELTLSITLSLMRGATILRVSAPRSPLIVWLLV